MKVVTYLFAILTVLFAVPLAHADAAFLLTTEQAQACPYSTVQIIGYVTNTGNTQETVTVTSKSDWIKIAPDSFTVGAGERETVYIYITPENGENKPGSYTLPITVKGSSTKEITKNVAFTLMSCHHVTLQPKQTVYNACLTENTPILFDITNEGKTEDTFAVTSNLGDLTNSQVTLKSGETKTVKLTVPVEANEKEVILRAVSTTTYAKAAASLTLYGDQCYTAELDVTPQQAQLCVEDGAIYTVQVRNTGSRDDTYTLKSSNGRFANNTLTVKAGSIASTTLKVNPTVTGEYDLDISATSQHVELETQAMLAVSQCRGVAVSLLPQEQTTCYGDRATFDVTVKNTGTKKDTYSLTAATGRLSKDTVELNAGEVTTVTLTTDTNRLESGTYNVTVNAQSRSGARDNARAEYEVDYCPSVDIAFEQDKDSIAVCPGDTIENQILVKNTGRKEDTYAVSVSEGSLKEKSVVILAPGVSRNVTWTIPTDEDATGEDVVTLTMKGSANTTKKQLTIIYKDIDDCYGFVLTAEPLVQRIESYQKYGRSLYEITVANQGERASTFSFTVDGPNWTYIDPKTVAVEGKGRGTTYAYMAPPYKINEGVYEATVHATSSRGTTKSITLQLVFGGERIETPAPEESDRPLAQKPREQSTTPKTDTYGTAISGSSFLITERREGSATVNYTTKDNKTKVEDITFRVGSFIMEVGNEKIEFENVTDGRHRYQVRSGSTVYRVLVDVKALATQGEAYNVTVLDVEVIENAPNTAEYQTQELRIAADASFPMIAIIIVVAIVLIVLILFWPNISRQFNTWTKKRATDKKKDDEEDDEEKESRKKKNKPKKKEERKGVKADINEILESI